MIGSYSSYLLNLRYQTQTGLNSISTTFTEDFNEYGIASAVTLSYLLLYTAYDKSKKTLVLKNLTDLITCARGVDWTLVECNKALSLAGMTTMLISFLPSFEKKSKGLLWISMAMLWTHSTYSMYKFYGYKLSKIMSDKAIKQLSIGFGVAGQVALSAGYYGLISPAALVYAASALSISHFWTMEVCILINLCNLYCNFPPQSHLSNWIWSTFLSDWSYPTWNVEYLGRLQVRFAGSTLCIFTIPPGAGGCHLLHFEEINSTTFLPPHTQLLLSLFLIESVSFPLHYCLVRIDWYLSLWFRSFFSIFLESNSSWCLNRQGLTSICSYTDFNCIVYS